MITEYSSLPASFLNCEGPSEMPPIFPLYLTEEQAEALVALCSGSTTVSADHERELFSKLGELLRGFRR
jgi:hypothetical protein